MKKILFLLFSAIILAACGESDNLMKCGEYDVATKISEDALTAVINGDEVVLKQTTSASGVRYAGVLNDTNVVLWNRESDWTLYLNDEAPIDCVR